MVQYDFGQGDQSKSPTIMAGQPYTPPQRYPFFQKYKALLTIGVSVP